MKIHNRFFVGISNKKKRDKSFDRIVKKKQLKYFFNKTEGMISFNEAKFLYGLAKKINSNCIVEIGSYRGCSTVALGRGSLDGHMVPVFAIEPHEEFHGSLGGKFGSADRGAFFKAMIVTCCYHVVRLINLSSEMIAPNWDRKIGLLWIDGDHSYRGVKRDFDYWRPHLAPEAAVAFHDSLNPQLGPYKLINELIADGCFEKINELDTITLLKLKNNNIDEVVKSPKSSLSLDGRGLGEGGKQEITVC